MSKNSRRPSCQRDSDGTDGAHLGATGRVLAVQIALATSGAVHIRLLGVKHALLLAGLGWGGMPEPAVRADLKTGRLVKLNLHNWRGGEYNLQGYCPGKRDPSTQPQVLRSGALDRVSQGLKQIPLLLSSG